MVELPTDCDARRSKKRHCDRQRAAAAQVCSNQHGIEVCRPRATGSMVGVRYRRPRYSHSRGNPAPGRAAIATVFELAGSASLQTAECEVGISRRREENWPAHHVRSRRNRARVCRAGGPSAVDRCDRWRKDNGSSGNAARAGRAATAIATHLGQHQKQRNQYSHQFTPTLRLIAPGVIEPVDWLHTLQSS